VMPGADPKRGQDATVMACETVRMELCVDSRGYEVCRKIKRNDRPSMKVTDFWCRLGLSAGRDAAAD
jgi:hypothetical protein